jgi:UDP-N-acetylmuramate dehydrogenase
MLKAYMKSLQPYNTFGIDVKAREFITVTEIVQLQEVLSSHNSRELLILGGGSNMLLTRDVDALVLHIALKGIRVISQNDRTVVVEAMAGENWNDFVQWCLMHNYGGIENLSLIPGNCGTAPIQNIGAYGAELKDVFVSCSAMEVATGKQREFTREECRFGYRQSIFKHTLKGKYVITAIRLELSSAQHTLNTSYGAISALLQKKGIENPNIRDVANAVVEIRRSKLPDPAELGNSGSFFKNPVVDRKTFDQFHRSFPDAPYYPAQEGHFKVPAGWLIEQAGFKGKRFGDAGVHKNQALVLVNYGNASGEEILALAKRIQHEVKLKFGIALEPEVNII